MNTLVRITHLEMLSRDALRPVRRIPDDVLLLRAGIPSPELARFLYTAVGGDWYWRERLSWSYAKWLSWLSRPEVELWLALASGTPAGYFELEQQAGEEEAGGGGNSVQITYFGLLPGFTGKGIGGYLLTHAVDRAWQLAPGIRRVWVHTCSLDHRNALPNYQARGFTTFRQEEHQVELPEQPPGPWPGAERPR